MQDVFSDSVETFKIAPFLCAVTAIQGVMEILLAVFTMCSLRQSVASSKALSSFC